MKITAIKIPFSSYLLTLALLSSAAWSSPLLAQCTNDTCAIHEYLVSFPGDVAPGEINTDSVEVVELGCDLISITYADVITDLDCDGTDDKLVRTWSIINWCTYSTNPNGPIFLLPNLDLDGDGIVGDPYDVRILNDSVFLIRNGLPDSLLTTEGSYVEYHQTIRYTNAASTLVTIDGTVFSDVDQNCELGAGENGIAGQVVQLDALPSGNHYETLTDSMGQYSFEVCSNDTLFAAHLLLPFDYAGNCNTTYSYAPPAGIVDTTLNLPVQLPAGCPQLLIDVGTVGIRPCFSSSYRIFYQNFSFDTISEVSIVLVLDPLLDFLGSGIDPSSVNGDTITIPIGTLSPLESATFYMSVFLDCNATVGQTHCVQANIYPDTLCEPVNPLWSGASLDLRGECQGDSVEVIIKNIGTNDMDAIQDYIVIEDVLMLMNAPFQLVVGAEEKFKLPANGATWNVSTPQVPFHPGRDMPSVTIEGCGGLNIPGQALAFPQNDANPFVSIDCTQSTNSYDPNDKQVFPSGIGTDHFVESNTDLEYLIRFQNTGTAPAIKVIITDTLSESLNTETLQTGASSHDYIFESFDEGRILRFTFDNIMLPDSNANEAESHGFVKFRIQQNVDLPLGTVIPNTAAIYFDFNDPIITNEAFVTIGKDFFEVINGTIENYLPGLSLKIYPNPMADEATVELGGLALSGENGLLELYNISNKLIHSQPITENLSQLNVQDFSSGIYILKVKIEGREVAVAKLLIH